MILIITVAHKLTFLEYRVLIHNGNASIVLESILNPLEVYSLPRIHIDEKHNPDEIPTTAPESKLWCKIHYNLISLRDVSVLQHRILQHHHQNSEEELLPVS
jgi:hypothetical protein